MALNGAAQEGNIDVIGNGRWVLETFLRGAAARPGQPRRGETPSQPRRRRRAGARGGA
jgi:hypothetical protein